MALSTGLVRNRPTPADEAYLLRLQRHALSYFVDNQTSCGLVLDRQRNHGRLRSDGLCSVAATGMGFIGLALAASPPHHLLSRHAAVERVRAGLLTALYRLPHDHGILPHFLDGDTLAVAGSDFLSTIDSAWLVAGALAAARLLRDERLLELAERLYARVDWSYWTAPEVRDFRGLIRHGKDREGRFLACSWDRLNGETVFMYVLAAGATEARAWSAAGWEALGDYSGTVAGRRFCSADLGLFVFQYGLDLLDLGHWRRPGGLDLPEEARTATSAHLDFCRLLADEHPTYRHYWGLSAGDGPGEEAGGEVYRCYAPSGPIDGTAHLTTALASVAHEPDAVVDQLRRADREATPRPRGRYGFSNLNVARKWVGQDMVGIDAGAAAIALDNFLVDDRVRMAFHDLPAVQRGLDALGFQKAGRPDGPPPLQKAS